MGNVVGIDLGTTNSVAAFRFANVEVVTAADNAPPDRKLTRSVVAATQDRLVIGQEAYNQLKADPENVIISIKRLIGRGFGDAVVQQQLSRFGYKISQATWGTENSLSVWLDGQEYAPEDISAKIIEKVVANAQAYQEAKGQQGSIQQVVVTIPAYFNDKQRYATQTAVRRAGFAVGELLSEPTAAAISYGFKPDSEEVKTILVYDFGGGTFDSSLITSAGNQFIEAGKAGDLWLGGDDIDESIIDYVKQQVAESEGLDNIDELIANMPSYQRVRFMGDLKMAVEQAKIELSEKSVVSILPATPLLDDLGMAVNVNVDLSRETFEEMILPLVERSITICQDTLNLSEYDADLVDVVLLVGGSSQIPIVQQKVREAFGADKVVVHPRPMYAVAEGAAIVSAGLTEKVSTVSRDYFIELVDNPRYKLVKQGDILPVTTSHTFKTEAEGQSLIHFKFLSPDSVKESLDKTQQDERIGDMWLALDSSYSKGTEVLVNVELDEQNNSLQITAALKNNPAVKVSSSFSRGREDEVISRQVEEKIRELNETGGLTHIGVAEANRIAGEIVSASNQVYLEGKLQSDRLEVAKEKIKELEVFASEDYAVAQFFVNDFKFVLEIFESFLDTPQKERIQDLITGLESAIATHNISSMQKLLEDARRELENLPDSVRLLLFCKDAIARANTINPTHGRAMAGKFGQILMAIETGNSREADRLLQELLPDVERYLEQDLPTGSIATGLSQ